jgi:hypothetical protein
LEPPQIQQPRRRRQPIQTKIKNTATVPPHNQLAAANSQERLRRRLTKNSPLSTPHHRVAADVNKNNQAAASPSAPAVNEGCLVDGLGVIAMGQMLTLEPPLPL